MLVFAALWGGSTCKFADRDVAVAAATRNPVFPGFSPSDVLMLNNFLLPNVWMLHMLRKVLADASRSNGKMLRWEGKQQEQKIKTQYLKNEKSRKHLVCCWKISWSSRRDSPAFEKLQPEEGRMLFCGWRCGLLRSLKFQDLHYSPSVISSCAGKTPQCFNWQYLELRRV